MATSLKLDTVARATIVDNVNTGPKITRTGIIKGINTLGMTADQVMAQCPLVPGQPAFKSFYPAAPYTDCQMTQVAYEPFEGQPGKTRALYTYERLSSASPIVTFVLNRQTTMVEEITEIHPGTKEPMAVTWIKYTNILPGVPVPTDFVIRTARFRYPRPLQRLTAKGYYRDGPPPADMINALNSVNDANWRGLAKGYWWYSGQSDVTLDKGGSYTITLELQTRIDRDWSQWQVLEDVNGRYLQPTQSDVVDLWNLPYAYDVKTRNGITKTGLFRLANFGGIFGFGGIA